MKKFLFLIAIFIYAKSLSQTKPEIDTNRIYVRIVSNFAKSNPSCVLFPTVPTYASGGPTIGVSHIPLNHSAWFPISCFSNNPITLTIDYSFKNKKPIPQITGSFHRGDSVIVDIDKLTTKIVKNK